MDFSDYIKQGGTLGNWVPIDEIVQRSSAGRLEVRRWFHAP